VSHQFKAGDLAIIIGAFNVPSNIGKVCELVERLAPEQVSQWVDPNDGTRIQNATDHPGWVVIGDGLSSVFATAGWVLAVERHLMPLRGDFSPDLQKSREVPA
jgi:hypothetical protein